LLEKVAEDAVIEAT